MKKFLMSESNCEKAAKRMAEISVEMMNKKWVGSPKLTKGGHWETKKRRKVSKTAFTDLAGIFKKMLMRVERPEWTSRKKAR